MDTLQVEVFAEKTEVLATGLLFDIEVVTFDTVKFSLI